MNIPNSESPNAAPQGPTVTTDAPRIFENQFEVRGDDGITRHVDGGPPQNPDDVTKAYFAAIDKKKQAGAEALRASASTSQTADIIAAIIDRLETNRRTATDVQAPSDPTSRALDAADQPPKSTAKPR